MFNVSFIQTVRILTLVPTNEGEQTKKEKKSNENLNKKIVVNKTFFKAKVKMLYKTVLKHLNSLFLFTYF